MMMRNRSSKLVLAAMTVVAVFTAPQFVRGDGSDSDHGSKNSIVGTWALTVPGTPFRINRTFFANGTNVDASTFTPITPTAGPLIVSDGHGAWKKTGHGTFAVTLFFLQLNPQTGALDTYGKVRESVQVEKGVYKGVFKTDIFLPDGTPIIHVGGTTEGTLIPVEPAT